MGSAHLAHITRCPHPSPPSCCWTPTPSVEWTRWSIRWHQRASRRPRKGRPTTLPPSLHSHHPILPPCKTTHTCPASTGWGWRAPPPFTHPHHHASHLSHSPRWRCHRSVGTTPHYLARLTRASTSTNPCRPYPSPRPLPPPSTGTRWRRGHQPTVRARGIDTVASKSIGASGGARRGPAARPVVVWGCAVV